MPLQIVVPESEAAKDDEEIEVVEDDEDVGGGVTKSPVQKKAPPKQKQPAKSSNVSSASQAKTSKTRSKTLPGRAVSPTKAPTSKPSPQKAPPAATTASVAKAASTLRGASMKSASASGNIVPSVKRVASARVSESIPPKTKVLGAATPSSVGTKASSRTVPIQSIHKRVINRAPSANKPANQELIRRATELKKDVESLAPVPLIMALSKTAKEFPKKLKSVTSELEDVIAPGTDGGGKDGEGQEGEKKKDDEEKDKDKSGEKKKPLSPKKPASKKDDPEKQLEVLKQLNPTSLISVLKNTPADKLKEIEPLLENISETLDGTPLGEYFESLTKIVEMDDLKSLTNLFPNLMPKVYEFLDRLGQLILKALGRIGSTLMEFLQIVISGVKSIFSG
ncbi:hypothetical protein V9T40_010262 [Parthenolecanium corni]|uniref:Uncharacterized protein n=1 Tax=Parthenolecanium corni TaxID=536013 RepID=A0AAN9TAT4_9HEMI